MTQNGSQGGHTRLLGVMGNPIAQSVSPAMHNEAFRNQRMNAVYGAFPVAPENLLGAVEGIRALGLLGVNVTIPYKEAVIPLLDEVAPTARQVGAVNTIVNRGGRLIGYNTDGWGFICSLDEAAVRPTGLHAVILGAGGAARAVATHLALAGVASLTVSNRTPERAEELAGAVRAVAEGIRVTAVEAQSPEERQALIHAGLAVNCTPLGMYGEQERQTPVTDINLLPQRAVVYDTIYRPQETRLMHEARQRGLRTIGGLGMLVHQGACAWEYWFGRRGPVPVMYGAARAALEGGNPA